MDYLKKPMDAGISQCLHQLAERAIELGEGHTAIVLYALCAHRAVGADLAMALTAEEQTLFLRTVLLSGGFSADDILGQQPTVKWPLDMNVPPPPPPKPKSDEPKS